MAKPLRPREIVHPASLDADAAGVVPSGRVPDATVEGVVGPPDLGSELPVRGIEQKREDIRTLVTGILTALVAAILLVPLFGLMARWLTAEELKTYYSLALAPMFSTYSAVITFYFVTDKRDNRT